MAFSVPPTVCNPADEHPQRVLARGRHREPGAEACLMELVSTLAGEPWSDHPSCVHPVLAAVARTVNDRMSESARAALLPLARPMIGTRGGDPLVSTVLVERCVGAALRYAKAQPRDVRTDLEAAHRLVRYVRCADAAGTTAGGAAGTTAGSPCRCPLPARAALAILRRAGQLERVYRRVAASQVACAVVALARTSPDPDRELVELLTTCTEVCRSGESARPASPR